MGTTRRGFLKALSAVLAAPSAAMAATKPVTPAPAPEFVGAGEWVTRDELEEAYLRTHPMIQVEAGVVRATDLSRMGPGEILHIDPHETPFLSSYPDGSPRYEWTQEE